MHIHEIRSRRSSLGTFCMLLLDAAAAALLVLAILFALKLGFGSGIPHVDLPGLADRAEGWTGGAVSARHIRILVASFFVLVTAFWVFACRILDRLDRRNLAVAIAVMGAVLLAVQLIIALGMNVVQNTDAFEVQDQALAIARGEFSTIDYTKSEYFVKYSNNDFYFLICLGLYRLCALLHILNWDRLFVLLNVGMIDLGVFFTVLIARRLGGIRDCARVMLLCALNPLNYLLVHWTYTCTFSLPVMMGLMYCLIRWISLWISLHQNGKLRTTLPHIFLLAAVMGILTAAGYYLRPTSIFPLLAALVVVFLCRRHLFMRGRADTDQDEPEFVQGLRGRRAEACVVQERETDCADREETGLRRVLIFLLCAVLFAGSVLVTSKAIRTESLRYDTEQKGKFPLAHWLMLGLTGNGRVSEERMEYTQSFGTTDKMQTADLQAVKDGLKEMGVKGTIHHLADKVGLTWSDGTGEYYQRTMSDVGGLRDLFQLINGRYRSIVITYCQAYRILLLLLALTGILSQMREQMRAGSRTAQEETEDEPPAQRAAELNEEGTAAPGIYAARGDFRTPGFFALWNISTVTVLGGLVFYIVWEGKSVYSYPFLCCLTLICQGGFHTASERVQERVHRTSEWAGKILAPVLALSLCAVSAVCVGVSFYDAHYMQAHQPSIMMDNVGVAEWVTIGKGETLRQDFYPAYGFDRILIRIQKNGKGKGSYRIRLVSGGEVFFDEKIHKKDVKGGKYICELKDTVTPDEGQRFSLLITNKGPKNNPLQWGVRNSYITRGYKGDRWIGGQKAPGNLLIRVYKE